MRLQYCTLLRKRFMLANCYTLLSHYYKQYRTHRATLSCQCWNNIYFEWHIIFSMGPNKWNGNMWHFPKNKNLKIKLPYGWIGIIDRTLLLCLPVGNAMLLFICLFCEHHWPGGIGKCVLRNVTTWAALTKLQSCAEVPFLFSRTSSRVINP
jgi:hypothetical protein